MKDVGPAQVMLGLEIKRDRSTRILFLSQPTYAETVLKRFGTKGSNPARTPMEAAKASSEKSGQDEESIPTKDVAYVEPIASTVHLMVGTRPSISYAAGNLSQHCENPLLTHWTSITRSLRYIRGSHDHGILFDGALAFGPLGYSDSD